jgi:hypothetical protein
MHYSKYSNHTIVTKINIIEISSVILKYYLKI